MQQLLQQQFPGEPGRWVGTPDPTKYAAGTNHLSDAEVRGGGGVIHPHRHMWVGGWVGGCGGGHPPSWPHVCVCVGGGGRGVIHPHRHIRTFRQLAALATTDLALPQLAYSRLAWLLTWLRCITWRLGPHPRLTWLLARLHADVAARLAADQKAADPVAADLPGGCCGAAGVRGDPQGQHRRLG